MRKAGRGETMRMTKMIHFLWQDYCKLLEDHLILSPIAVNVICLSLFLYVSHATITMICKCYKYV